MSERETIRRIGIPSPRNGELPVERRNLLDDSATREWLSARQSEGALAVDIARFLVEECGDGFGCLGAGTVLRIGGVAYRVGPLFYHVGIRRFVVFELKVGVFDPEYVDELAVTVDVVDDVMRRPEYGDRPTVGILMAVGKSGIVVEYALGAAAGSSEASRTPWASMPLDVRRALPDTGRLRAAAREALAEGSVDSTP